MKGLTDCRPALDRVHKVDLGRRKELADEGHLGERGTVEMPDAPGPQGAEHARLGVAFDGVEDIARKPVDKPPCRAGNRRRTQAQQRIGRPHRGDDGIDQREAGAPQRTGRNKADFCHRTILQTRRRHAAPCDNGNGGGMTNRGGLTRLGRNAPKRQTVVRGLRIACRTISVSLKDADPQGRLDRKRRVTS